MRFCHEPDNTNEKIRSNLHALGMDIRAQLRIINNGFATSEVKDGNIFFNSPLQRVHKEMMEQPPAMSYGKQ